MVATKLEMVRPCRLPWVPGPLRCLCHAHYNDRLRHDKIIRCIQRCPGDCTDPSRSCSGPRLPDQGGDLCYGEYEHERLVRAGRLGYSYIRPQGQGNYLRRSLKIYRSMDLLQACRRDQSNQREDRSHRISGA